ncbi:MAG: uroporphyrinogen-III C-methyltransferase [Bryobacterales bacterium]|nr:uroporphyrinogen-III C-methyltransferase [Bryobacterales bacterium]MBV9400118.1 uroporphyrinogen-III C-methyltransferase [Bryobacterales bacterium]
MKVYLVGAGPGDPELITLKGRRVLEAADCLLYDFLANERLLNYAPAHAERIYVGKKRAKHEMSQQEISGLLIDRARRGWTVVRLKGGDPFIFGRGGEEMEALADAGIPFEIVPGVTAALGLAAYTGVPLTHREHTSAVTFVTGHRVEAIDWAKVGATETIVLFMGLVNFAAIAAELIASGRSRDTPAMIVRWATRPDQETLVGTLSTLPAMAAEKGIKPPATIVIGEVVSLRDRFNWFERLPLFGKRIVVTRDRRQAAELARPLEELGAEAISLPTIEIQPAADTTPLDRAIARIRTYDWLIFTSVNGVRFFIERLDASHRDLRAVSAKICAIGPATAAALQALHLKVDLMPQEYVAESLVEAFTEERLSGRRILLPRAAVARDLVPTELTRRGAHVDVVEAYRTVPPADLAEHAAEVLARNPHWIVFSSSSTVKNLEKAIEPGSLQGIKIASIGPITSKTIGECGLEVDVEANPHTIDGLVAAIVAQDAILRRVANPPGEPYSHPDQAA